MPLNGCPLDLVPLSCSVRIRACHQWSGRVENAAMWCQLGFKLRVKKYCDGISTWEPQGGHEVLDQKKYSWGSSLPCRVFSMTGSYWWAWLMSGPSQKSHSEVVTGKALFSLSLLSLSGDLTSTWPHGEGYEANCSPGVCSCALGAVLQPWLVGIWLCWGAKYFFFFFFSWSGSA